MSQKARDIVVGGILIFGFVAPFVLGAVAERLLPSARKPSGSRSRPRDGQDDPKIWYDFDNGAIPADRSGIEYRLDFDRALADAKLLNKPIFVYFTTINDVNARHIHINMVHTPSVTARLQQFVCAALFVDRVPYLADPAEASRLREQNEKLLEELIGGIDSPAFAVIRSDFGDRSDRESRTPVAIAHLWDINDDATVIRFLDEAFAKWSSSQVPK